MDEKSFARKPSFEFLQQHAQRKANVKQAGQSIAARKSEKR